MIRPERDLPMPFRAVWHALYWTFERATWQYDIMVILILGFIRYAAHMGQGPVRILLTRDGRASRSHPGE